MEEPTTSSEDAARRLAVRGSRWTKAWNLLATPNRLERLLALIEIKLAISSDRFTPADDVVAFNQFRNHLCETHPELARLLADSGEAERAVRSARARFQRQARDLELPFPEYLNADLSFGMLCHALTRYRKPGLVVETGAGYGISSALVLQALEENAAGELWSMDLAPLADPEGRFSGIAVDDNLLRRWTLYRNVSSRKMLPLILKRAPPVDLFISDSANVYTLQRFELSRVWPRLSADSFAILNNTTRKLGAFARRLKGVRVYNIWQVEKTGCATTVIQKTGDPAAPPPDCY